MSEHSAHELARTRLCREPQCEELAVTGDRGRYANLCDTHLAAAKRRANGMGPMAGASSQSSASVGGIGVPALSTPTTEGASYEQRARALVGHAKQVDKALAKAKKAKAACAPPMRRAQAAKEHADRTLEQFKSAVRELVA